MAAKPSLEELLEDVDPSRLSQPCKDHHLSEVALHITEWQSIAPFLRLTEVDDKEIRTKFSEELVVQNMAMLRRWRERRGCKATYKELAKVFWKLGKLSLVEEVCKVLRSEWSSSESEGEPEQGCVVGSGSQRWTVPRYASYLKGRYHTIRPPVLSLQWPPPPTHTVFNLALIQKEMLEFGPNEELVRLLQRGQVKEAAENHSEIELSNLMTADDEVRKVVLIEGAPGSGKSTLAWHICQQWEKGELFTEYEVVVFVQLRDPSVQSATSLADIFPVPRHSMGITIDSFLTGDNRWGRGVLLVLDGWDELQPDCPAHSLLMQLVQIPDYLDMHFSSLIITSRPVSSGELQRHASSRVEVLGFKSEEVQEYFKSCLGRDHQLYTRFVDQLSKRPVIEASCFLPLNAVIVVHTFLACGYSLPHTLHGVFEKLVLSCIVRHVSDRGEAKGGIKTSCFSDLPPDVEVPLSAVSSLAFHGIWVNKAVFSERDLKVFNLSVDLMSTLSLVQVVESFGVCGCSKSYNFFHLQIQELLAAYHISKLEEDEQVRIFQDLFEQPRFAAVFQFYAAFTELQAQGVREVLVNMLEGIRDHSSVLQCVYEAQDPSLCQFVGYTLHVTEKEALRPLFYLRSWSNPLYVIALGYFLCYYCYYCSEELFVSVDSGTNMKLLVKKFLKHQSHITAAPLQRHTYGSLAFEIHVYDSEDTYWESFVQCTSELLSSLHPFITGLVFSVNDTAIFQKLPTNLGMLVQHPSFLQHLGLVIFFEGNVLSIEEPDIRSVHSIHSLKQLHSFKVQNVKLKIPQSVINAVCSGMASKSAVRYLKVHNCWIDVKDPASTMLHAIPLGNTLKAIDLTGTSLGRCVSPLLMGLASNTSVVELILEDCRVDLTRENGQALCELLRTNITLRALNLRGIYRVIVVSGKEEFTQAVDLQGLCLGLTLNTSLAYLDLSRRHLTVTGESGPVLAHMLQTNTTLKSLKLDCKGISNEGAVYLAQELAQNRGLETLSLAECGISTAVVELAEALKTNKCLLSLDISDNDVGGRFVHIVRSLQVNSTLQDLRIRKCDISALDWRDIAQSSLQSLDLSYNPIGDESAAHIAQWVTKSRSLYQLNLEGCDIRDRGVECLASALERNMSLEILHIPRNRFTDTGLLALGRSLKRNKSLKTLNVAGCGTSVGLKQFMLSLCENEYLTHLCVMHSEEVRDEVNKVNQIRQDKNRNTLSTFTHEYL